VPGSCGLHRATSRAAIDVPGRHPHSLVRQGVQEVHWAELGCRICARPRHWMASAFTTITFLASLAITFLASLASLAITFLASFAFLTTFALLTALGFVTVTGLVR
jgi:hypothetical protein